MLFPITLAFSAIGFLVNNFGADEVDLRRFFQIDSDYRRRAQFVRTAETLQAHAEPFESALELARFGPTVGVVFVHDENGAVARTIAQLEEAGIALPVIGYRQGPSAERIVDVINAGAVDYVSWPIFPQTLRRRLNKLARRTPREALAKMRKAAAVAAIDQLSMREKEVLALLASGQSNKEMGHTLGISPRTVEIHRANMMSKLGQTSAAGVIYLAYDADLVKAPIAPSARPNERKQTPALGRASTSQ